MILYGDDRWDSPYVFTVFVALREKGIPFEARTLALAAGESRQSPYRERSVTGRVPGIEHDDFWLTESLAIVEYLEEAFPAPKWPRLLPESLHERARARQVMGWLRSDLLPLREERSTETMFYERATTPLGPDARASADRLLSVTEQLLRTDAVSLCSAWCVADAELSFALHRLVLNGDEVPERVRAYAEATWQRPSVRSYVERERPKR